MKIYLRNVGSAYDWKVECYCPNFLWRDKIIQKWGRENKKRTVHKFTKYFANILILHYAPVHTWRFSEFFSKESHIFEYEYMRRTIINKNFMFLNQPYVNLAFVCRQHLWLFRWLPIDSRNNWQSEIIIDYEYQGWILIKAYQNVMVFIRFLCLARVEIWKFAPKYAKMLNILTFHRSLMIFYLIKVWMGGEQ